MCSSDLDKVPDYNGCLAFYLEPSAAIPYPITLITASNKSLLNKLIKSYGFREDVCIDINKIDDYTLPEICEFEIVIME